MSVDESVERIVGNEVHDRVAMVWDGVLSGGPPGHSS